jgi:hypothetical protein
VVRACGMTAVQVVTSDQFMHLMHGGSYNDARFMLSLSAEGLNELTISACLSMSSRACFTTEGMGGRTSMFRNEQLLMASVASIVEGG